MAESKTISIRLEEPYIVELERLAAAENSSPGLSAKRLLCTALDGGATQIPSTTEHVDIRALAAEIANHLGENLPRSETGDDVLVVLRELVIGVTREGERNGANFARLSRDFDQLLRDLRELCRLLEAGQPNGDDPNGLLRYED
jgi:hypothetical protein